MTNEETARIFKAFCDGRRIEIIRLLSDGEKCACKLLEELEISQPTRSHHMKILCDSGIINSRKEGKWTHYSLCEEGAVQIKNILSDLLNTKAEDTDIKQKCCNK